jgi:DNA-binding IclR family transcriptional regulator
MVPPRHFDCRRDGDGAALAVPHAGNPVSKREPGSKVAFHQRTGRRMKPVGTRASDETPPARKKAPQRGERRADVPAQSQIQVIARAAAILRALEDEAAGLSLGQISQRVNLARSTVQRIVAALEAEKFLIAASPNGRVRLGPTIQRLAAAAQTDFVALARPYLVQLSEELRETVDLSVVKYDHLVFVDQVIGSHRLRAVSAIGETFPLHCTANGKAYLAGLDDAAVAALIGTSYLRRTPHTLIRLDDLLRDLKAVRKSGIAIDREEHTRGICAAGTVLRDGTGNFVAISVPVPAPRFHDHERRIVARLKATKAALERQFVATAA